MKRRLLGIIAATTLIAGNASADLIINLTKTSVDGVTMSISGSGTVLNDGGTGDAIDFNNFTGQPFGGSLAGGTSTFALVGALTITGLDSSNANAPYSSDIDEIDLIAASSGGSDMDLNGDFSIGLGDTFLASGSAFVTDLSFSDLNVGTYTASTAVGDANEFGTVTLNVVVPEPTSLAVLAIAGLMIASRRRR